MIFNICLFVPKFQTVSVRNLFNFENYIYVYILKFHNLDWGNISFLLHIVNFMFS